MVLSITIMDLKSEVDIFMILCSLMMLEMKMMTNDLCMFIGNLVLSN